MSEQGRTLKYARLSRRYGSNGKAALHLNKVQRKARDRVLTKIASKDYNYTDVACPLCGCDEGTVISQKDMYGLPCEVAVCGCCDFVYTNRHLDTASLVEFYNKEYRPLDRGDPLPATSFFQLQRKKGAHIFEILVDAGVRLHSGSLVIEMGCGAGGILDYFRSLGHPTLGFDLGSDYLEFGRAKYGLDLRKGDAQTAIEMMSRDNLAPKLVIYEQVLEHLSDPIGELSLWRNVLPSEAVMFIGVPGLRNIASHYGSDFMRYLQLPHLCHFDLESLRYASASADFDLVKGDETVRAILRPAQNSGHASGKAFHNSVGTKARLARLNELEQNYGRLLPRRVMTNSIGAIRRLLRAAGLGAVKRQLFGAPKHDADRA